ncbi:hypothetical protein ASD99_23870 [Mesorhizobium sp. Root695]|nr:hypothetical protein ASD99_23870 [Mesorhizobium sp. Root695]
MANANPPLSSTVETIFTAFLKQLEADETIPKDAIKNLRNTLEGQKLDAESLRKALFPPTEPK